MIASLFVIRQIGDQVVVLVYNIACQVSNLQLVNGGSYHLVNAALSSVRESAINNEYM